MNYKPYPDYKSSGVDWLGDVPKHWEVRPLKYITNFINGAAFKPSEWASEGVPIIRIENLNGGEEFNYFQGEVDARYHIQKNDLLFGWSGNRGTSFGPFLWWGKGLHYLNQHIFKLDQFGCDKKWLFWTLRAVTYYVEEQAHGIIGMVHVTKGELGAVTIPLISLPEQQAIVAFLDRQTAKIDALIAKTETLIKRMQERRSSLISHAVTKGLNPNVELKPSGVDWLGDVPKHWDIKRARFMISMNPTKKDLSHLSPDTEVSFIPMEAVGDDGSLNLETTRRISDVSSGYTYFAENDVTFAKITPCFENGKGAIMRDLCNGFGFGTTELTVLRTDKKVDNEYLYYLTVSSEFRKNGEARMYGAGGQKRVPDDFVKEFRFSWPPLPEQHAIVDFLDRETAKIDRLIQKNQDLIKKMKERRTALISAAVTGKIDVRQN